MGTHDELIERNHQRPPGVASGLASSGHPIFFEEEQQLPGESRPHTLLADGRVDPLAVDGDTVSLSWSYAPRADQADHVAIQLASNPQLLAEGVADLHTVALPPQTIRYTWPVPDLPSGAQIRWRAGLVYPGSGTAWSAPAFFERPLLRPEDWGAERITDSSWLQDSLPHQLPGKPASPDVLAPGYSTLPAMVPAVSRDVTQLPARHHPCSPIPSLPDTMTRP